MQIRYERPQIQSQCQHIAQQDSDSCEGHACKLYSCKNSSLQFLDLKGG